jgi:hypothetical protein
MSWVVNKLHMKIQITAFAMIKIYHFNNLQAFIL